MDADEKTIPQIRPWARYWARHIDYFLWSFIMGFILAMIYPPALQINQYLLGMLLVFLWILQEAIFLSTWGTTPGKWLLKTEIKSLSGSKLPFKDALKRSFLVWLLGVGAGFPLAALFTCFSSYQQLTNNGLTLWDFKSQSIVSHQEIGTLRIIITILIILSFIVINSVYK